MKQGSALVNVKLQRLQMRHDLRIGHHSLKSIVATQGDNRVVNQHQKLYIVPTYFFRVAAGQHTLTRRRLASQCCRIYFR